MNEVWATIGGFHLAAAGPGDVQRTIDELKLFGPRLMMPLHCTGFDATRRFAEEMREQFVLGAVGTTLKI